MGQHSHKSTRLLLMHGIMRQGGMALDGKFGPAIKSAVAQLTGLECHV